MAITIPGTITGSAQTGFTSPTYTTSVDSAPDVNAKQVAVTAIGGTQAGVTTHAGSDPFTLTVFKPKTFNVLGKPNPVTGLISNVPMNRIRILGRKGVLPLVGQPRAVATVDITISVPAGSDTADTANIRAMLSAAFGLVANQSAGIGDTSINFVL